jgi:hypothetical protein
MGFTKAIQRWLTATKTPFRLEVTHLRFSFDNKGGGDVENKLDVIFSRGCGKTYSGVALKIDETPVWELTETMVFDITQFQTKHVAEPKPCKVEARSWAYSSLVCEFEIDLNAFCGPNSGQELSFGPVSHAGHLITLQTRICALNLDTKKRVVRSRNAQQWANNGTVYQNNAASKPSRHDFQPASVDRVPSWEFDSAVSTPRLLALVDELRAKCSGEEESKTSAEVAGSMASMKGKWDQGQQVEMSKSSTPKTKTARNSFAKCNTLGIKEGEVLHNEDDAYVEDNEQKAEDDKDDENGCEDSIAQMYMAEAQKVLELNDLVSDLEADLQLQQSKCEEQQRLITQQGEKIEELTLALVPHPKTLISAPQHSLHTSCDSQYDNNATATANSATATANAHNSPVSVEVRLAAVAARLRNIAKQASLNSIATASFSSTLGTRSFDSGKQRSNTIDFLGLHDGVDGGGDGDADVEVYMSAKTSFVAKASFATYEARSPTAAELNERGHGRQKKPVMYAKIVPVDEHGYNLDDRFSGHHTPPSTSTSKLPVDVLGNLSAAITGGANDRLRVDCYIDKAEETWASLKDEMASGLAAACGISLMPEEKRESSPLDSYTYGTDGEFELELEIEDKKSDEATKHTCSISDNGNEAVGAHDTPDTKLAAYSNGYDDARADIPANLNSDSDVELFQTPVQAERFGPENANTAAPRTSHVSPEVKSNAVHVDAQHQLCKPTLGLGKLLLPKAADVDGQGSFVGVLANSARMARKDIVATFNKPSASQPQFSEHKQLPTLQSLALSGSTASYAP